MRILFVAILVAVSQADDVSTNGPIVPEPTEGIDGIVTDHGPIVVDTAVTDSIASSEASGHTPGATEQPPVPTTAGSTGDSNLTTIHSGTFAPLPVTEAPPNCGQTIKTSDVEKLTELLDEIFDSPIEEKKSEEFESLLNELSPKELHKESANSIWNVYKEFRAATDGKDTPLPHWYKQAFRAALVSAPKRAFIHWLSEQWFKLNATQRNALKTTENHIQETRFKWIFHFNYEVDPGNMTYVDYLYWELYCIQPDGVPTGLPTDATDAPTTVATTPEPATDGPSDVPSTEATPSPTDVPTETTTGVTEPPAPADPCVVPQSIISTIKFWIARPYANYSRLEPALAALPKKVSAIHAQLLMDLARELQKASNNGFWHPAGNLYRDLIGYSLRNHNSFALKRMAEVFWCSQADCQPTEEWKKFEQWYQNFQKRSRFIRIMDKMGCEAIMTSTSLDASFPPVIFNVQEIFPTEYKKLFPKRPTIPNYYEYLESTFTRGDCIYTCPQLSSNFMTLMWQIIDDPQPNDPRIPSLQIERKTRAFGKNFPVLVEMTRDLVAIAKKNANPQNLNAIRLFKHLIFIAADQQPNMNLEQVVSDWYNGHIGFGWRYIAQTVYPEKYQEIRGQPSTANFYEFLNETFHNPEQCRPGQYSVPLPPPPTEATTLGPTGAGSTGHSGLPGDSTDSTEPSVWTNQGNLSLSTTTPTTTSTTATMTAPPPIPLEDFGIIVSMASECPDYGAAWTLHERIGKYYPERECLPSIQELHVLLCLTAFYKEKSRILGQDDFLPKLHAKGSEMAIQGYDRRAIREYVQEQMSYRTHNEIDGYEEIVAAAEAAFPELVAKHLSPEYPQDQTIEEFIDTYIGCNVKDAFCNKKPNQSLNTTTTKIINILKEGRKCELIPEQVSLWVYLYEFLGHMLEQSCDNFLAHLYRNVIELTISNVNSKEIQSDYIKRQWERLSTDDTYVLKQYMDNLMNEFHRIYRGDLSLVEVIGMSMNCPERPPNRTLGAPPLSPIPIETTIPTEATTTEATSTPRPTPDPTAPEVQYFCPPVDLPLTDVAGHLLDSLCQLHPARCINHDVIECVNHFVDDGCDNICIYLAIANVTFGELDNEAAEAPLLLEETRRLSSLLNSFIPVYDGLKRITEKFPKVLIEEYLRIFFPRIAATGLGVTDHDLKAIPLEDVHFFDELKERLDHQFEKNLEEWEHGARPQIVWGLQQIHKYAMNELHAVIYGFDDSPVENLPVWQPNDHQLRFG